MAKRKPAPAVAPGRKIGNWQLAIGNASAFTMIEIAICLAIIGFALASILAVLPLGMSTQRDNREETIVNQDATVLLEAIRSGARGADDLANYVYAISNTVTPYNNAGLPGASTAYGYGYSSAYNNLFLTSGSNIVGLLSTPEYVDLNGLPIASVANGGFSNHIIAYVRAMSGLAADKPPQNNVTMLGDAFTYRVFIVNAPVAVYTPPSWQAANYNAGDMVTYILGGKQTFWLARIAGPAPVSAPQMTDIPNSSLRWERMLYPQELTGNQRELRLTFRWPVMPNGVVMDHGASPQTFRATIAGQLAPDGNSPGLYFYQPQTFIKQ